MRYKMDYTLFKRRLPSGKIVYYYMVYDEDGKRIPRSTGERSKALADKYVRGLAEQGKLGMRDGNRIKLKDYAKDFFIPGLCPIEKFNLSRGRSGAKSSMSIRRTALVEHIFPHLGNYSVCSITRTKVDKWLVSLPETDKVSRSTANSYLDALRNVFAQAMRDGLIKINPTIGIERLGNDTQITKAFTKKEVDAIIGTDEDWKNPVIRCMCILAALTGMRIGEIRALKANCISEEAVMIKASFSNVDGYKAPKNGKERIAPLPPGAYEAITKYLWDDSGYVFRLDKRDDRPISSTYVGKVLAERMEKLGIKGKSFHSFRAFFNTQAVSANLDGETIRAIMGHANESMTLRYLHTDSAEFPAFRKLQEEILSEILA